MPDNNKTINPGGLRGAITRKLGDSTTGAKVHPLPETLKGGGASNGATKSIRIPESVIPGLSGSIPSIQSSTKLKMPDVLKSYSSRDGSTNPTSRSHKSPHAEVPKSLSGNSNVESSGLQSPTRLNISKASSNAIIQYFRNVITAGQDRIQFRNIFENIDREIARENNVDPTNLEAQKANYLGDKSKDKIADVVVPVVYPQLQAAYSYLVGIFLTGNPIFESVAAPDAEDVATQMNAIITEQSTKTGWIRHLALIIYDALRYNFAIGEVDWKQVSTYSITNDTAPENAGDSKVDANILWEGNFIERKDVYNSFWDTRVAPAEVHSKGEYAGYTDILSRIALKKEIADLQKQGQVFNIKEAFESSRGGSGDDIYYVPQITKKLNIDPRNNELNWMAWALNTGSRTTINYKGVYQRTVMYARILPDDFDLAVPAKKTVQIWKFIIINQQILIYAERMTNAHDYLPMIFCQPLEDGLDYQTKSFAENLVDFQNMASQLWNIRIAAARRNVSDRAIYDPTKIDPADINSSSPNAKIPIRPNSYGRPITDSFYPIPFDDRSSSLLIPDAMRVVDMGRSVSGINAPQEGTFIKGNRTESEFQTVAANANNRLQTIAQFIEAQFMTPVKEIIKINILQFQKPASYFSDKTRGIVNIDPVQLRNTITKFQISDGLLPVSKIVDTDFLQVILQASLSNPVMAQEADIFGMLSYLAKLKNIPFLDQFRRQQNVAAPQTQAIGAPQSGPAPGNPQNSGNPAP